MPFESQPKNLDFSNIRVQQNEAGWGVKVPARNRIEIYNWKNKREARRALAAEYVEGIEPGTTRFEARKLHAEYRKTNTKEDYNFLYHRNRSKRGDYFYEQSPEEQALTLEIRQRSEDQEFDRAYDESEKSS